jgi:uncharacterized membrane protein YphA (DoxX/SURF4 family)
MDELAAPTPGARGWSALGLIARLLLASVFIASGAMKLFDFTGAVAEVRTFTGVEPAALVAGLVIVIQLSGSALLIMGGRGASIGCALLAGFTFAATLLGHAFWMKDGPQQARDFITFLEHMGLIGGLILAALISRRGSNGHSG